MSRILFSALAAALLPFAAFAQEEPAEESAEARTSLIDRLKEDAVFSGTAEFEGAVELDGDGQKFELILQPELELKLAEDWFLTTILRLRADALDRLEPGSPHQPEISGATRRLLIGDPLELELREFYLETTVGDAYLTLGKQQVVWGKADGIKVLDVVNPQDFREFTLDDFDDSRIPLWMANAEIPIGETTLQLLWIPDQTYHNIPEFGAKYELSAGLPSAPGFVRTRINEVDRPSRVIADSDIGARLSAFLGGWDLTLNYLYHYDDVPVVRRRFGIGPLGPKVTVNPGYERAHLIGGTFSNAFGDLTIRGELGYSVGKFFSTGRLLDRDGVFESDQFSYVLGFDWFGISETFLSFQFFQDILVDGARGMLRDKVETNISLNVMRDFRNDTIVTEVLWVHNLNDGDGYVRPKITYEARSNFFVWAGFDIFYGGGDGTFGQFNSNDRFVFGLEWGF